MPLRVHGKQRFFYFLKVVGQKCFQRPGQMIATIVPMAKSKEHADSGNNGIGVGIGQDIVDGGFQLAGGVEERK